MIRALVVDDERIARAGLRGLLVAEGHYDVVGECATGVEAVRTIRALTPDLVFLDVQMPDLDGFGVLRNLDPATMPAIVFVTAYDQYALRAFEANAVDYLLKPFDRTRLRRALERAGRFIGRADDHRMQVEALLRALDERQPTTAAKQSRQRVAVKDRDRVAFVDVQDVAWVQSDGNYLRICAKDKLYVIRDTLRAFESRLDARRFLRVSRSALVNVDEVRELRRAAGNQYVLVMSSGHRLLSSRRFRGRVASLMRDSSAGDA